MKTSTWAAANEQVPAPTAASSIALETKPAGKAGDILVPEETIFGMVSRYHTVTGHQTSGDTLIELLNQRSVSLSISFPSRLHLLVKALRLPLNSIQELVEGHTILPYFRPFMDLAHYNDIAHAVAAGTARNTKIALGLLASRVGAEDALRFCPACEKADCDTIGIATWYRAHQLPGVLVCPYHGVPLVANGCLAQRLKRQQLFLPATARKWSGQWSVPRFGEQAHEKLLRVSRLSTQLLILREVCADPLFWRDRYLAHLVDKGLATATLRVRQQALRSELVNFWAAIKQVPPFDGVFARCNGDDWWLTSLYRRSRAAHHPLLHVLLIGFLAGSIESFLWADMPSRAIAALPQHRHPAETENRIAALAAEGRSMRQVARELGLSVNAVLVKAEKIGVGFTRRSKQIDVAVRSRVRCALAAGDAVVDIAHATQLSSSTINRILGADASLQTQRAASAHEQRQTHARGRLKAAVAATPSAGFKALQVALGADFMWLYRHDRAWLRDQLPVTVRIAVLASPVDWEARDKAMVERARLVVAEILNPSMRPVRVTVNEIGRRTGNASWLDKHLARLPRTGELLAQVLEPVAAFQTRRLAWWEQHPDCQHMPRWYILRAAGMQRNQPGVARARVDGQPAST